MPVDAPDFHSNLVSLIEMMTIIFSSMCQSLADFRDLSDMRNELARASHSAQVSCAGLTATLHSREGGTTLALEREKALRVQLEQQLRERVTEMMNLQTRTDAERSELNVRSVAALSSRTVVANLTTFV